MRERTWNPRLTFILWTLLCAVSMTAMLLLSADKTIAITDVAWERTDAHGHASGAESGESMSGQPLKLARGKDGDTRLCIPLAAGVKAEQVEMENRYMDRQLWIYIENTDRDFYLENALSGNIEPITESSFEYHGQEIVLKMQFEEILEFQSVLDGGSLYIEYQNPRDVYDRIVVIDPAYGGSEEGNESKAGLGGEITLNTARALKERLDKTNIKAYYTRLEDMETAPEKRAGLANDLKADMYIRIGVSQDEADGEVYGIECVYNGDYFIPELDGVRLADILEREVTTAVSGRAEGLTAAGEDSVLGLLQVPACEIRVGYLSNARERELLKTEIYQKKAADGIAEAIRKAYSELTGAE